MNDRVLSEANVAIAYGFEYFQNYCSKLRKNVSFIQNNKAGLHRKTVVTDFLTKKTEKSDLIWPKD